MMGIIVYRMWRYRMIPIMSVPAIVVKDEKVVFGKKDLEELLELAES